MPLSCPSEEVLEALLKRNSDIFGGKVGTFNRVQDSYYIEDASSKAMLGRSEGELKRMIQRYEKRREDRYASVVSNANVGTFDETCYICRWLHGFYKFIKDMLDYVEEFPFDAMVEPDGHCPVELAFFPISYNQLNILVGGLYESGAEFLKRHNPQLAQYLNDWSQNKLGNAIEHKGVNYVISPIECYVGREFVITGIHYAPKTTISNILILKNILCSCHCVCEIINK